MDFGKESCELNEKEKMSGVQKIYNVEVFRPQRV